MFQKALASVINQNAGNDYEDNFDFLRYGDREYNPVNIEKTLSEISKYFPRLDSFYNLLADERSQSLLVKLVAFRILGHKKIKLPLSIPAYWESREIIETQFDKNNFIDLGFNGWKIYYGDFNRINIPLKLYTSSAGVLINFLLKQYEYQINENNFIRVEPGDIVIDGGGCWGDTALSFALQAGLNGKIYTFEFIPNNLKILKENLKLNPELNKIIEIIPNPLWDQSDVPVYYKDFGPASIARLTPMENTSGVANSVNIDEIVERKEIYKLDFIKMDIEGAEQQALKGAYKTLKKFRPKLAITIYHSINDFANIVHLINNLGLGYKFYLGHFTIHTEETVLYCKVEDY